MRFRHGYVHGCVHAGVGFSFAKLKPPLQPKAESPMADLVAAQNLLRSVFGFASFREGQAEIIETILAGRDVLAVMPTGSGKSLCYQLPALLRDGLTVVVSPLIALMRNQVAQLRDYGVRGGEPELEQRCRREPAHSRPDRARRVAPRLYRARAARQARHRRAAAARQGRPAGGRRSPLHLAMGP